jgi:hypothetical protein
VILSFKVNKQVSVKQVILVLKSKLALDKESALYVYHDKKLIPPNKLLYELLESGQNYLELFYGEIKSFG